MPTSAMQPITNESITVVVVRGVVEEGPLPFFVVAVFVFAVGAGFGFFLAFCAIFARSCSAFGREGEKDNGPLYLRTIGQINQSLPIINYQCFCGTGVPAYSDTGYSDTERSSLLNVTLF